MNSGSDHRVSCALWRGQTERWLNRRVSAVAKSLREYTNCEPLPLRRRPTCRAPAEADALSILKLPGLYLTANPDVAAWRPPPAGTFAVAIPTTPPPTPAKGSVPIDTIVPIVFDMAVNMMAVTMTVFMTLMAVAGKCRRRNEQSGGNCRH